jgi:hypothetical protein
MRPETRQTIGDIVLVIGIIAVLAVLVHQVRHFLQVMAARNDASPSACSRSAVAPMSRTSIDLTASRAHSTSVAFISTP